MTRARAQQETSAGGVVYRLDGGDIFIQRVRHGREDWINDAQGDVTP